VPEELRGAYHRELDQLDVALATLLGLIPEAIGFATAALLSGDLELAQSVQHWRGLVDDLYGDVEATIEAIMARQAPVARDLRFLLCSVRILPEVRDALDLIERIGDADPTGFAQALTPRARTVVREVGELTAAAWVATEERWRNRDLDSEPPTSPPERPADPLNEAQASLAGELSGGNLAVPVALEMTLRAQAYDRLARHSAAVDRLIGNLAGRAERPPPLGAAGA
jgi:phosphate transport system protein